MKLRFVYPDKSVIEASKASGNLYTHPLIKLIFWDRFKVIFNYLKHKKYDTILEVGCECGLDLPSLCQIADRVVATDIEKRFPYWKDKTLSAIQKSYPNLELALADATKLSQTVPPNSCDVILALSVL